MTTSQPFAKDYDGLKGPSTTRYTEAAKISEPGSSQGESVSHLAQHLKEDTLEIMKSANTQTQKKMKDLKTYAGDTLKKLEGEVSAKPIQSMAISFAVGALLSHLLARR